MNYLKTAILLAAMTAFFGFIGFLIGGVPGMMIALAIAIAMNFYNWWNSDKAVLKKHGARLVTAQSEPELVNMVAGLARNANMPMPKVFIMENDQPNAFATGRNPSNAAVAATTGLLARLSPEEVAGVMAHELAHIKNHDTLIMTITASISGAIGMLINFGMFFRGRRGGHNFLVIMLVSLLAPMAAAIVQMAISRTREYAADRMGGEICGNPLWLAGALRKIEGSARGIDNEPAEANPATAHMFIINPLNGRRGDKLFSTHPNTDNRVHELELQYEALGGRQQVQGQRNTGFQQTRFSGSRNR